MKTFSNLRIVEIGGSVAGAYCTKLFADNGAHVVRVGDDQLTEAQRIYLHQGKEHVPAVTPAIFIDADVVVESSATGPLRAGQPHPAGVIGLRISPYGSTGPCRNWLATELTNYAHAGHLHLTGDPDREPLSHPTNHPPVAAGLFGFIGVMGALFDRERHGRTRDVEVATHEVLAALHQLTFMRYLLGKDVLCRMGNRYTGQGEPNGLLECADGWVAVSAPTDAQVEMLLLATGLNHLLDHPKITSPMDFQSHPEVLRDALDPWLMERTMTEVAELFQAMRIPTAPARPMLGLLEDEHLAEREFWRKADGITLPGPPFRFGPPAGGAKPLTDSDDQAGPLSGVRVLDLCKVWAGPLAARTLAELGAEVIQVEAPWGRGPQELPESLVWAQRFHPDNVQGPHQWNRNGHLIKYGLHKQSVVLDLSREEGVAALERIVPHADVVIENFSPRVMPQLGLDEDRLHELNPGLVYMTMPGYGRSGPSKDWVAYGTTVDSHAGLSHLIGYPDQTPWKNGVAWPDPIAGLHAASAIMIALWRRPDVGGVTIEGAQFEATVASVGDSLVDAQLRGMNPTPLGNRHQEFAPQGVYRCVGDDRWIALSVLDEPGWQALCSMAGLPPEWTILDAAGRHGIHDSIDIAISAWTADLDHLDLADLLQNAGIAAAAVLDAPGVLTDKQLLDRGALIDIDQPEVGMITSTRMPVHFLEVAARDHQKAPFAPLTNRVLTSSKHRGYSYEPTQTSRPPLRYAALLGEHNQQVLQGVAGLSDDEYEALIELGIVATEPPE